MPTPFDQLDAELSEAVLTAYGEAASIVPRRGGQYASPGFDAERGAGPIPVMGVFTATPEVAIFAEATGQLIIDQRTVTADAIFWMTKAQVAAIGFTVKRDDQLIMVTRPGKPTYTVIATTPTEQGDEQLYLAKEL